MISFFEICRQFGSEPRGQDIPVSGISEPHTSQPNDLVFIFQKSLLKNKNLIRSKTWAISPDLFDDELENYLAESSVNYTIAKDIYDAFVITIKIFYPDQDTPASVHPSAMIDPSVILSADVGLGPFCSIGAYSRIAKNTILMANVVIGRNVVIGEHSRIYPNVTVYDNTVIGRHVIIHAGCVIGSDGFGFYKKNGRNLKIPHVGKVIIEDDVEIGANSSIDRGTLGETRIGRGTKIDNLVQIAHNVIIGENALIAAQTGIAGSTSIGSDVTMAGQVGIVGHIRIGNRVTIGAQSGVISSIEDGKTVSGYPARDHAESLKKEAYIRKIPEILEALKKKT